MLPGSQALWVANGTNVLEFASTSLTTKGSSAAAPSLTVSSSAFAALRGLAFDSSADLWVVDGGNTDTGGTTKPALYEFTPTQLMSEIHSGLGLMPPNVTIHSSAFVFPQQAAFDSKGDLWVSDSGANAVYEFTPAQLMASGANVMPNIAITSNPAFNSGFDANYAAALGLALDAAGDLWVANNGANTILEFNAAALAAASGSVTLTPNVVLSNGGGNGAIENPWALAFDSSGNLWFSNAGYVGMLDPLIHASNTVIEFPKASLAASGSPTPAVTLSSTTVGRNASLNFPTGIAFDSSGDLSVVNSAAPYGVGLYSASQLTTGGAVAPNVLLMGTATTLKAPAAISFGPAITP
jgi:secreted PhoX family phosphatase